MKRKIFIDYKEFLQEANKNIGNIKSFKYYDNRLFSFMTPTYSCKYLYDNGVMTPNKFVKNLGFENYNAFISKRFSKLKDFANSERQAQKWYSGFFGGLVGINRHIINDYVGNGEVNTFYDYDINSAYLHTLTGWLPTYYIKSISYLDFQSLTEIDKIPYIYFFELKLKVFKSQFLKAVGTIKEIYKSFDFLNAKQGENVIVSEKRLNLINQIYFKDYEVKNVFVFERGKFKFYQNILHEYLKVKDSQSKIFKQNALRLYGTFGQIWKYENKDFKFDTQGDLIVNYKREVNFNSSPQVAMWVADTVAEKLFNLISLNYKDVICWNTDGLTTLKPLNLQISKEAGKWKMKKFDGIPFLQNSTGARLFFKDLTYNDFVGANNIVEKDNKLYEEIEFNYSNLNKGFVNRIKLFEIKKDLKFDELNSFRNQILKEKFKQISREYEEF